jgi:hypothetical protein
MQRFQLFLADAVLVTHVLVVVFNATSLPIIWLGGWLKWGFVKNVSFRTIHVALLGFIAVQALAGKLCPLTHWEASLRVRAGGGAGYATGFVAHWLQRLIFFDADPWVFTAAYVGFFGLTVLTLFAVPPRRPCWGRSKT